MPLRCASCSIVQELLLAALAALALGVRDRRGQVGVAAIQLAGEHAADHRERQAAFLHRADPPKELGVVGAVQRHPALAARRRQQALRPVEAHGVDRDVAFGGELLDAVLHDR